MNFLASLEILVLLGTAVGLVWLYLKRKWLYLTNINISHERPSLLTFGNAKDIFYEPFTIDNKNKEKYGSVWGYYINTAPHIVVHDRSVIRKILIDEFENFPGRQTRTTGVFGQKDGLNKIAGAQWRRVRSTIFPTFPPERLKHITPIIGERVDDGIASLASDETSDGDDVLLDCKEMFSRSCLDCILSAVLGKEVHFLDGRPTKKDHNAPSVTKTKSLIAIPSMTLLFAIYLFPVLGKVLGKILRRVLPENSEKFFFKRLSKYVIDERRKTLVSGEKFDVLKLMIESEISDEQVRNGVQKGLTEAEIFSNTVVFVLAGYENPSNQIGFLAYNLAQHPDIQAEVQSEIDDMGKIDYDGINELKMLDMCVHESMRLYTPVVRLSRICTKRVTIDGVTFPKGVFVEIPVYALAHDHGYWDEPYKFKPQRMCNMDNVDPMMFLPFGGGPRECLAIPYVKMMIKMSICKLLRKFSFKPSADTPKPPLNLKMELAVRPVMELNLLLLPRDSKTA